MHIVLIVALTTTVMSTQAAEKLQFAFMPNPAISILSHITNSQGTRIEAQLQFGNYSETIEAEQSNQTGCKYVQKNSSGQEIKKSGQEALNVVMALMQYEKEDRDRNSLQAMTKQYLSTLSPKSQQQFKEAEKRIDALTAQREARERAALSEQK